MVQISKFQDRGIENENRAQGYEKRVSTGGVFQTKVDRWGTGNES